MFLALFHRIVCVRHQQAPVYLLSKSTLQKTLVHVFSSQKNETKYQLAIICFNLT